MEQIEDIRREIGEMIERAKPLNREVVGENWAIQCFSDGWLEALDRGVRRAGQTGAQEVLENARAAFSDLEGELLRARAAKARRDQSYDRTKAEVAEVLQMLFRLREHADWWDLDEGLRDRHEDLMRISPSEPRYQHSDALEWIPKARALIEKIKSELK